MCKPRKIECLMTLRVLLAILVPVNIVLRVVQSRGSNTTRTWYKHFGWETNGECDFANEPSACGLIRKVFLLANANACRKINNKLHSGNFKNINRRQLCLRHRAHFNIVIRSGSITGRVIIVAGADSVPVDRNYLHRLPAAIALKLDAELYSFPAFCGSQSNKTARTQVQQQSQSLGVKLECWGAYIVLFCVRENCRIAETMA